jgi:steroid 5-alpha reductase family enzyme
MLLISLAVLLGYMACLFVVALITKNNGVADVGYGVAFIVVILASYLQAQPPLRFISGLLIVLTLVWGVRLAVRIGKKNYGKPEDFRYKAWRDAWGNTFIWRSFLQVYMLQGLVVFVVSLPVTLAFIFPAPQIAYAFVIGGIALWLVGFYFEAVGDYQLDTFIKNSVNSGHIMMSGLWKYTRHPNYFGESLMWVGIALIGLGTSSIGIVGIVSPLLITYLLLFVSGVPMLEKRWEGNVEWETYKKKTSVFIPLPPSA